MFITVLTRSRHRSLCWDRLIQSTRPNLISPISVLILFFYVRLGLLIGHFPSGIPTNILHPFSISRMRAICEVTWAWRVYETEMTWAIFYCWHKVCGTILRCDLIDNRITSSSLPSDIQTAGDTDHGSSTTQRISLPTFLNVITKLYPSIVPWQSIIHRNKWWLFPQQN